MMAWRDLSTIETPRRIAALPKDSRGYPIFFMVNIKDGKPDFRDMDPAKGNRCIRERLCGICGAPLGKSVAFVGGPMSIRNRLFGDPPSHVECARYALQACPFLAMPSFSYQQMDPSTPRLNPLVTTQKPDVFGLGITTKYRLVDIQGNIVVKAGLFSSVQYWRDGSPVQETN